MQAGVADYVAQGVFAIRGSTHVLLVQVGGEGGQPNTNLTLIPAGHPGQP